MRLKPIFVVVLIVFLLISIIDSLSTFHTSSIKSIAISKNNLEYSKLLILDTSITILNPYTFVRDNENWTVAFNTTGEADLIISSTNANWTEFLTDDVSTKDEMKLLEIKCGENSLMNSLEVIDENENYYNYSQLTESDSIKIKKLLIRNYSCDGTGYITNNMLIAGYAALQFNFDDQVAYAYDDTINNCSNLNTTGTTYYLSGNVNSSGTCFNVTANSIILDCQGYTINYSQSVEGYAVNDTGGYDNITIKNCNIVQGSTSSYSFAISGIGMANSTIQNNSMKTNGAYGHGISLDSSSNNNSISYNNVTASGSGSYGIYLVSNSNNNSILYNSVSSAATGIYLGSSSNNSILYNSVSSNNTHGIYLYSSSNNSISYNNVTASGNSVIGIYLGSNSNNNSISYNNVTASGIDTSGIYLVVSSKNSITGGSIIGTTDYTLISAGATNNFTNTNFTAARNISLDTTSWFNYANNTSDIWLRTNGLASTFQRTLNNWNQANVSWNDNIISDNGTVSYTVYGLIQNANYTVYNYTTLTPFYTLNASSCGCINFTIFLNSSSRTIQVNIKNSSSPYMHIAINGSETDNTTAYPTVVNITAWENNTGDDDCVYKLYRNTPTTSIQITGNNETITLGADNYTYVFNTSGCTNYFSDSITRRLNITKGNPFSNLNIYIDGSVNNKTIIYPSISNVSANSTSTDDSDCTYNLLRNNIVLISGKNVWNATLLGNGTYAFKYNMSGQCTNWTLNSSQILYLYVNKGSANLTLTSNVSWNASYSNASNVTGYECPTTGASDFNCNLYRNTSGLVAQGKPMVNETILLGVGAHLYVWNISNASAANWTFNSTSNILTVIGLAKVDQAVLNTSTIYNGTSARISCNVKDFYTEQILQGYNVSFYNNTFLGSSITNGTGWATYDYSDYITNPPQNITLTCNITDQPNLYYNTSSNNSKNITLNVVNLVVKSSAIPTSSSFGSSVSLSANVSNNASAIDSVIANFSYTNTTNGHLTNVTDQITLDYIQNADEKYMYSKSFVPPRSGYYNVTIFANASRVSSNTTNFSVNFGQPVITFTFPNYRVMVNQTFNFTINLSSINGDIWYTNLTLNITNQSVINIAQGENFNCPNLYNISNGSVTTVSWNVSSLNEGLTTAMVNVIPTNGSSLQELESHKVLYPILFATPNTTNITLNTTLRAIIIGNVSSINSVNLTIAKAYSQDTDYATSIFTQNLSEIECTGESLGNMRVTLLSAGAYSNVSEGNRTINNDYGDSWASSTDLFIFLNSTYTIDRFSIYWKNVTGSGNATIYYNTTSGWATIPSLSSLVPPVGVNFTNISGFSPIVTNAFKFNQTNLASQIYEFEAYQVQGRTDKCYIYDFNFSNITRSGNYSFNVSIKTQNSLLFVSQNSNSTFFINFGSPTISISSPDVMLTNYSYTYKAIVNANNGDLRNITLNLTIYNQSVLNITSNETWNKTISEILNDNSDSKNWTITGIQDGSTDTGISVNSSTGKGSYAYSNFSINVTSLPGDLPNATNFWFSQIGMSTSKTNLYTNLTIYANVTDDVSLSSVIANITYPDNKSVNVTMTGTTCYLPQWCTWNYTFGNNLHLNSTGNYTVRITAFDIGNQNKSSGIDAGSPNNMNFTVYGNYTLNLTSNYTTYMRGENVTVQAIDVNNYAVESINWTANITKINETYNFTSQATTFNYTVLVNDTEGNYSITVNSTKNNNTGNSTWNFNVSKSFTITITTDPSSSPGKYAWITVSATLYNARGDLHTSSINASITCTNTMYSLNFSSGQATYLCRSPDAYSTPFNITVNVSDQYNNTGENYKTLTTESAPSTGGGGGGGGGGFVTIKNCSDGTLYNQCSSNRPLFCKNGVLIENCSVCKCESGYYCQIDGSCKVSITILENFTFILSYESIEIERGENSSVIASLSNTGNMPLTLVAIAEGECCNVSMEENFSLNENEEREFTISIHVPLFTDVGEHLLKIKIGKELFKKEKIVDILVTESTYCNSLSIIETELTNLEKEIQDYKKVGINTRNLENLLAQSKLVLSNAISSISNDQINVLSSSVSELENNIELARSTLTGLMVQKFLTQNGWLIILLVISIILNIYLIPEVLIPLQKIEKEIKNLKNEEKVSISSRVETEKQYFMRKIDENTFYKMMISKQENILKVRTMLNNKIDEKKKIIEDRLKPMGILRWIIGGIKNIPNHLKNIPKNILNRKNKKL